MGRFARGIAAAAVVAALAVSACSGSGSTPETDRTTATPVASSAAPTTSARQGVPSEAMVRCGTDYTGEALPGTVEEFVCQGNDAPVFLDNRGTAVEALRIADGTHVSVECYEPNLSGMSSVTAFYIIAAPKDWLNLRAPSDVFWNGGMDKNINRNVRKCDP